MEDILYRDALKHKVEQIEENAFEALALEVFAWQAVGNPVYARYLDLLGRSTASVHRLEDIPFFPIGLFKQYDLQTGVWKPEVVFTSSGTTQSAQPSRHLLRDGLFYRYNARRAFEQIYGPLANYRVLALLPAYLERTGSSLVYMAQDFIEQSSYADSGFFLHDMESLLAVIRRAQAAAEPTLLLGVSFALLDLAEKYAPDLNGIVVMETGGMKGRRKEMTRQELHAVLCDAFSIDHIHSEYGMTELLSQAYAPSGGIFTPAPSMRVYMRELTDPFNILPANRHGAINVIDLANLDTISFIATDDLGKRLPDGRFEVLGRIDNSDVRGCNLMVE
jgi:hypothetical protein